MMARHGLVMTWGRIASFGGSIQETRKTAASSDITATSRFSSSPYPPVGFCPIATTNMPSREKSIRDRRFNMIHANFPDPAAIERLAAYCPDVMVVFRSSG